MIYDSVENRMKYKDNADLFAVLEYFASVLQSGSVPESKTELRGSDVFVNPVTLETKPQEQCVYEAHKNYCDVHCIISGTEGIAVSGTAALTEHTPYDAQKDIGFYTGPVSQFYYLKPGEFMYCPPEDAHMVAVMQDKPEHIVKLVGKIRAQ